MSDVSTAAAPVTDAAQAGRVRPPRERPLIALSGVPSTAPSVMTLPSGEVGVGFSMYAGREDPALMFVSFPGDASGDKARKFAGDFEKASATVEAAGRREEAPGLGVDLTLAGRWRKGAPVEGKSSYWFEGVEAAVGKDLTMPSVEQYARDAAAKAAEKEAAKAAPAASRGRDAPGAAAPADKPLLEGASLSNPAAVEQALRASKKASIKDPEAFVLVVSGDQAKGVGGDALAAVAPMASTARDAARDTRRHGGYRSMAVPYAAMAAKLVEAGPEAASGFLRDMPEAAKQSSKNGEASHAMYRATQARAKASAGAER